jgi:hypothetical protein
MNKRPVVVTIVSLIFIAAGIFGLVRHTLELDGGSPFQADFGWMVLVNLIGIVAGAFMLLRRNWAVWLAVLWFAGHVILSIFGPLREIVVHGLLFALIVYLLFRPETRAWFRRSPSAAG